MNGGAGTAVIQMLTNAEQRDYLLTDTVITALHRAQFDVSDMLRRAQGDVVGGVWTKPSGMSPPNHHVSRTLALVADLQQRSTNLSRPPQIGPCVHTIRGDDVIAFVGMGKSGAEARKWKRPPG